MTKFLFSILITSSLFGIDIPQEHAKEKSFAKSVALNAQIIQLSNSSQSVTTQISGHLEKYYVEAGERVKAGQKIALIESLSVSKMTADFIALKKQYKALEKNHLAMKNLYSNGMTSMQELNKQSIAKDAMFARMSTLKSQLNTLNINTQKLKRASAYFTLYAHSDGKVSELILPLHASVSVDEGVINILKEQAYYVKAFVPLKYASKIKVGQKMILNYNGRSIVSHLRQILPSVDVSTQRIVVLASIDEIVNDLYVNSYVDSTLYFDADKKYVAVKKSALSFFNNEWVVFIPKNEKHDEPEEEKHEEHASHEGHDSHDEEEKHEEHASHEGHDSHDEEEKHEGHDSHDEESESPYEIRVVKILVTGDEYVGVEGIEINEEYVSAKSYYVKSMMLKSSLGEHGH